MSGCVASAHLGWAADWGDANPDGSGDVQAVTTAPDADGDWAVSHLDAATGS